MKIPWWGGVDDKIKIRAVGPTAKTRGGGRGPINFPHV